MTDETKATLKFLATTALFVAVVWNIRPDEDRGLKSEKAYVPPYYPKRLNGMKRRSRR